MRKTAGFSYVEVMVALVVLAVCAVPAAEAIRGGTTAAAVAADKANELRCMKNRMETVLAEPYDRLENEARLALEAEKENEPSATYSLDEDAGYAARQDGACMARWVFISYYERKNGSPEKYLTKDNSTVGERQDALLRITVAPTKKRDEVATSSAGKYGHTYTFTTLVWR